MTDVVRLCKPTYSEDLLCEQGIEVHDWLFTDGEPPPKNVIDDWLYLINSRLKKDEESSEKFEEMDDEDKHPCIAVHCVAGLGRYEIFDRLVVFDLKLLKNRAPVLVAIALIEEGMDPLDSVALIRKMRRGAINNRQLKYLETYKRRRKPQQQGCFIS